MLRGDLTRKDGLAVEHEENGQEIADQLADACAKVGT